MAIVDLRSDTVTKPTVEMIEAMAKAEVGDDVYGEDPTINQLQDIAAEKMGKAAGLFVPSGTMGNLIAVMVHCQRGDEAIMGDKGHTFSFEAGGISALGGVFPHTLPNQADGTLKIDDILGAIRPDDIHHPVSRLVILENTQNRCGGVVLSKEYTNEVCRLAHDHELTLHIDGARIFNAAVALATSAKELVSSADSVTFCLSKGLCAPVGSVLCGSREFIDKAKRIRKMLGGGMRQAGILAAAGLVALESMVERLVDDHRRAGELANGLARIDGIQFEMGMPQTNMVFPSLGTNIKLNAAEVSKKLAGEGIKVSAVSDRRLRLVTHAWVDDEAVRQTINAFEKILS
jgi:threonine aldolase